MTLFVLQTLALVAVCLWAFARGAAPERYIAATLIGMLVIDQGYHVATNARVIYVTVDLAHLLIDCFGSLALTIIALNANRLYPILMAATQLISALSHFARSESSQMAQGAYAIMMRVPFYLLIAILAFGVAAHAKRSLRFGSYPSWRQC